MSVMAWGMVAIQAGLFMTPRFASGGYARFLVPVCAMLAVLAAEGIWTLRTKTRWAGSVALFALAAFHHFQPSHSPLQQR